MVLFLSFLLAGASGTHTNACAGAQLAWPVLVWNYAEKRTGKTDVFQRIKLGLAMPVARPHKHLCVCPRWLRQQKRQKRTMQKIFSEYRFPLHEGASGACEFFDADSGASRGDPEALEGAKTVLATAQTGTGKTLAFLIP